MSSTKDDHEEKEEDPKPEFWRSEGRRDTIETAPDFDDDSDGPMPTLKKTHTHSLGILKLRAEDDHDPTDWWFASTAIPLIAATLAPMANLLSIAALVVPWRNHTTTDTPLTRYATSEGYPDPHWIYALNVASLACGFIGNLFLLFNFTKRVRYIIALPVTIIFFYFASGILIAIVICMNQYTPPKADDVYSQGYWHAVIAAILYLINSMILMANMLGYFLGHYPQHFTLNDEQRNLILQTMLFFIWLGGGAGVFARTQHWTYPDALYFCDVTLLTIGFGDYVAYNDLGRGLVFPFSVGGTIILGLMVSSIHKFARELSKEKVIKRHVEKRRINTLSRAVTMEPDSDSRPNTQLSPNGELIISRPLQGDAQKIQKHLDEQARREFEKKRTLTFMDPKKEDYFTSSDGPSSTGSDEPLPTQFIAPQLRAEKGVFTKSLRSLTTPLTKPVSVAASSIRRVTTKNTKKIIMIEERDRFNAMRSIQTNASTFKRYYALTMSIIAFGMLWCLGAMVFYFAELETQATNYFEQLYFCYVSLLTIGYGDLSPRSDAGKAFFVVWSLIAVPMMTILVSDLGDTVIGGFKRGVLQNDLGLTSNVGSDNNSQLKSFWRRTIKLITSRPKRKSAPTPKQLEEERTRRLTIVDGIPLVEPVPQTIDELVEEEPSEMEMMRRLAFEIRHVADDLKHNHDKKYSYEEWVNFTRLIRFSKLESQNGRDALRLLEYDEDKEGIVEWDWLDEHSPMTSEQTECEWVLDRLCESMLRVFKRSDLLLGALSEAQKPKEAPEVAVRDFSSPPSPTLQRIGLPNTVEESGEEENFSASASAVQAVTKWFRGDEGYAQTPQWSKRAKAKMTTQEVAPDMLPEDRRRSSTSVSRRQGPFAQAARRMSVSAASEMSERRPSQLRKKSVA